MTNRELDFPDGYTNNTQPDTGGGGTWGSITGDIEDQTDLTTRIDDKVKQTITNGVTTSAPSQDAVFDALALKAPLTSPALTGNPTAPTQSALDNSTKVATTAYVDAAVAAAPGGVTSVYGRTGAVTAQSGDYTATQVTNTPAGGIAATTVQAAINELDTEKANIASPTFTGTPAAPTPAAGTSTTQLSTTAFVESEIARLAGEFIANGTLEVDASGWAAYKDAAATSPVDGTGGSPTLTVTRTTSSPLEGVGSLKLTKPASNIQGEGASYDFTVSASVKESGTPLTIRASIKTPSGYSDDHMSVWIYDVTNSVLIQPTPYLIKYAVGTQHIKMEFQPNTSSSSYRLIFHFGTTSTTAYDVLIDEVSVRRNVTSNGASISEWTSFTPTGSWSSNTTYTGFRRRVGDSLECVVKVATSGAPTSATLYVNLPSGLSADTSKLVDTSSLTMVLGQAAFNDSSSTWYFGDVCYNDATSVRVVTNDAGSSYLKQATADQSSPFTFGASDYVVLRFTVPIAGWGTSQVLSTETDTRIVSFQAVKSAGSATANTAIGSWTLVNKDTHSGFNSSTGEYTVPIAGDYVVDAIVNVTSGSPFVSVYKNGTAVMTCPVASAPLHYKLTNLVANDKITIAISASLTISTSTAPYLTSFGVERVSGPAQVAASEKIFLQYTNNGGNSITSNTTNFTWSTKVVDSHGAWNGTTFTAPRADWYNIAGCARFTTTNTGGIAAYVNGTNKYELGNRASIDVKAFGGGVYLNAGDALTFRINTNCTLDNDSGTHWISITSQG